MPNVVYKVKIRMMISTIRFPARRVFSTTYRKLKPGVETSVRSMRAKWAQLTRLRARIHRSRLRHTTFIGITGSAGKTTTKDITTEILSAFGGCESNPRSANEPGATARTVLRTRPDQKYCVAEVSGGAPGILDLHLPMLQPDVGVLTLIARDHFKNFRSLEAIAAEKRKLIDALPVHGTAVLNIDDPLIKDIGEGCTCQTVWVGEAEGATIRLISARSHYPQPLTLTVEYEGEQFTVPTNLHGKHLTLAVLASLGVAVAVGIPLAAAIDALAKATPPEGRMEIVANEDGTTFVRDDWKAPFWSLNAPFEFMADARADRKVIIIGTVSDYSLSASKAYQKVAQQALAAGDLVVFVGPHALRAAKTKTDDGRLQAFPEIQRAADFLRSELRSGDLVLLKGSNTADHLIRLLLDRSKRVECWRDRCGMRLFCGRCPRVYQAMPASQPGPAPHTTSTSAVTLPLSISATASRLIVGLGNPGSRYHNTPHNLGYLTLDRILDSASGQWQETTEGSTAMIELQGEKVCLFKPGVSINNSGPVVRQVMDQIRITPAQCILIHDDMDLAIGEARAKHNGGDSGHKGVRSVLLALGTGDITRVRVGARKRENVDRAKDSVLSAFSTEDLERLYPALYTSIEIVEGLLKKKPKTSRDQAVSAEPDYRPAQI